MEKSQEFFAKVITKEKEFLISKKCVLIGRSQDNKINSEINGNFKP